jgi:hypothetical protein
VYSVGDASTSGSQGYTLHLEAGKYTTVGDCGDFGGTKITADTNRVRAQEAWVKEARIQQNSQIEIVLSIEIGREYDRTGYMVR